MQRLDRRAILVSLIPLLFSMLAAPCFAADAPVAREWTVDGVKREALVVMPEASKSKPSPLVFAFHGHGGNMRNAARSFAIEKHWPEAIVVYMQGLPTPGRLTDPEGKRNGWQHAAGDQKDRDLKFFDAVLADLKKEVKVDASRIYSTGHSNGGGFTYLLWAERGDVFAAMAPSAAAAAKTFPKLKPKPVMHLAGRQDNLVKFDWQQMTMNGLRRLNKTDDEGKEWGPNTRVYSSPTGPDVVCLIHPGAHQFPKEAPAAIVKFFKQHAKSPTKATEEQPAKQ